MTETTTRKRRQSMAGGDLVERAKARLADIEPRIASLSALVAEAKQLRAMIAAAEPQAVPR